MRHALTLSVLLHAVLTGWWLHRRAQQPPELSSRFEVVIRTPAPAKPSEPLARPAKSASPPTRKVNRPQPKPAARPKRRPVVKPTPPVSAVQPAPKSRSAPTRPVMPSTSSAGPVSAPAQPVPPRPATRFDNPRPWYPRMARRRGMEGRVELKVRVDPNGRVAEIRVQRSSGYRLLDDAALETVKTWRFIPARLGSRPIEATVVVPIRFRLQGGEVRME